jgi:hypothetical protein
MDKITDYQLVSGKDPSKLTEEVKKEMEAGWEPLGAPVVMDRGHPCIVQAMVIYKRGGP